MTDTKTSSSIPEENDQLEKAKEQAKSLGIKFSNLIGLKTLKKRIANHKVKPVPVKIPGTKTPAFNDKTSISDKVVIKKLTPKQAKEKLIETETDAQRKTRLRKEQLKLVRVVVQCNNPQKKEYSGQTFKVANSLIGSYTKFVPFGNEAGYHIPQIMLDTLNDYQCQMWRSVKLPSGERGMKSFTVKEFIITVLPDLTEKELAELADDQRARGAID